MMDEFELILFVGCIYGPILSSYAIIYFMRQYDEN
jgi:hypothetical protein